MFFKSFPTRKWENKRLPYLFDYPKPSSYLVHLAASLLHVSPDRRPQLFESLWQLHTAFKREYQSMLSPYEVLSRRLRDFFTLEFEFHFLQIPKAAVESYLQAPFRAEGAKRLPNFPDAAKSWVEKKLTMTTAAKAAKKAIASWKDETKTEVVRLPPLLQTTEELVALMKDWKKDDTDHVLHVMASAVPTSGLSEEIEQILEEYSYILEGQMEREKKAIETLQELATQSSSIVEDFAKKAYSVSSFASSAFSSMKDDFNSLSFTNSAPLACVDFLKAWREKVAEDARESLEVVLAMAAAPVDDPNRQIFGHKCVTCLNATEQLSSASGSLEIMNQIVLETLVNNEDAKCPCMGAVHRLAMWDMLEEQRKHSNDLCHGWSSKNRRLFG
eukprot:Filipodium_phascolosomae@DN5584_c0_g1_i1.p1